MARLQVVHRELEEGIPELIELTDRLRADVDEKHAELQALDTRSARHILLVGEWPSLPSFSAPDAPWYVESGLCCA